MRAATKRVSGLVVVSQGLRKEGCTKLVDGLALGFDRVSMGSSRSVQIFASIVRAENSSRSAKVSIETRGL